MSVQVVNGSDAVIWLREKQWLPLFALDHDFSQLWATFCVYLEQNYFTGEKSVEFNHLAITYKKESVGQYAVTLYRMKENDENLEVLRCAIAEYFQKPLMTKATLNEKISIVRERMEKHFIPGLIQQIS